jgi:peptidoglycan/LPS O-acetylase OafA/YrhL
VNYNPALDGLRAVAILAVLAFHAGAPFAASGFLGVDLFFVLSGFLITSLLVVEQEKEGSIALGRFYLRRAARLYPTLLLMLAGFVLVAPNLWPELPAWRYALWSALYLSDYSRAFWGEPIVLSYTWSLSVEEHFYLLWPLVLPAVLRAKSPARLLAIAYVAATAWRIVNFYWLGWDATYFRFDTRLSGLILGCLLAFWRPDVSRLAPLALAGLVLAFLLPSYHFSSGLTAMPVLAEACAAVLILSATHGRMAWASHAAMAYVGRLSYGLYIWHFPAVYWLRDRYDWEVALAGSACFAFVMAAITYHLIDVPIRRRMRARRSAPSSCTDVRQAASS